jgi:hypothetical protein
MTARAIVELRPDLRDGPSLPRVAPTGIHGLLDHAARSIYLLVPSPLGLESSSPSVLAATISSTR